MTNKELLNSLYGTRAFNRASDLDKKIWVPTNSGLQETPVGGYLKNWARRLREEVDKKILEEISAPYLKVSEIPDWTKTQATYKSVTDMSIDQMYPDMMIDYTQFAKYVKKEEEKEMKKKNDIIWRVNKVDVSLTGVTATLTGIPKHIVDMCSPGSIMDQLQDILDTRGSYPRVEKVIFNNPATIIIWSDGTKTVVKCQKGDTYDKEKGFAMAYLKKLLGNDNTFNKEIHKWIKEG